MNERIKEIAELCTLSFVNMHGEWEEDFDKAKFAELIVQECAIVANRAENSEFELRSMYNVVTEHFGVTE